jgi:hypothetical protein
VSTPRRQTNVAGARRRLSYESSPSNESNGSNESSWSNENNFAKRKTTSFETKRCETMEQDPKSSAPAARRSPVRSSRQSSVGDLRALLAMLQDKDPNQVMEVVKEGSLTQGMILATLATIVLLLACTAGPYAWEKSFGQHPAAGDAATAKAEPAALADSNSAGKPQAADSTAAAPATDPAKKAARPLVNKSVLDEVSDVKQSDPNSNPLESKIDDLFDKSR